MCALCWTWAVWALVWCLVCVCLNGDDWKGLLSLAQTLDYECCGFFLLLFAHVLCVCREILWFVTTPTVSCVNLYSLIMVAKHGFLCKSGLLLLFLFLVFSKGCPFLFISLYFFPSSVVEILTFLFGFFSANTPQQTAAKNYCSRIHAGFAPVLTIHLF